MRAISSLRKRINSCPSLGGSQYESSSGMGERHCTPTAHRSISVMRSSGSQAAWCTVRYTLSLIITWQWQACAGAIEGQGRSLPAPA